MRHVVQMQIVVDAPDDMAAFEIQEHLLGNWAMGDRRHEGITVIDPKVSLFHAGITHGAVDTDDVPCGPRVEPRYRTNA